MFGLLAYIVGLIGLLEAVVHFVEHLAYGSPFDSPVALEATAGCLIALFSAHWLVGESILPTRVIVYYVVAYSGARVGLLPITHSGFWGWTSVDVAVFAIGAFLLGGAIAWAYRHRMLQAQ